jgi:flavin reductase (DIM6/NTAB) family NADH-FMN oxidoreductase RutF
VGSAKPAHVTTSEQQRDYRQAIGHFATGVAVVTAQSAEGPVGMTANALC